MSVFMEDGEVGQFIVTESAKKAILADLPSRSFDGTGDDYIARMQNEYVLKGTFSRGIWTVKLDVTQSGRLVVSVIKPLSKRLTFRSQNER